MLENFYLNTFLFHNLDILTVLNCTSYFNFRNSYSMEVFKQNLSCEDRFLILSSNKLFNNKYLYSSKMLNKYLNIW